MPQILQKASWLLVTSLFFSIQGLAKQADNQSNANAEPVFELIVLGDSGGIEDGNLSAFLLRSLQEANYIALDAGTVVNGINHSIQYGAFDNLPLVTDDKWGLAGTILRHHVKGYLLSHAHLDHVNGMLVASPEDSKKNIYALASVNTMIGDTYFNGKAWANFSDRGIAPRLNQYHMVDLPLGQNITLDKTELSVSAFSLSHPVESGAFVIEHGNDLFVYFGDTGPDSVEKQGKLDKIWTVLAKQLKYKTLRGIIIETSFENERPDHLLFGHLTPNYLMQELHNFAAKVGGQTPLKDLKVVISHIKYTMAKGSEPRAIIKQQLDAANDLGVQIIIPQQGQRLLF
jgi:3',5'-cyclic-nucleotide phosphodiesterase